MFVERVEKLAVKRALKAFMFCTAGRNSAEKRVPLSPDIYRIDVMGFF